MPAPQRSRRRNTPSQASKRRSKATTTTAAEPNSSSARLHFVGGKGGAGKTTCAAAIAVDAAKRGTPTLIISTDPAPSLGDALEVPLSHRPKRLMVGGGTLYAAEIDARKALNRWLAPRRRSLERIALRGTWLDEEDVSKLLQLSLPGIDEVAALLEIARLSGDKRFDLIVVDTAPTGHTLRMLISMPEMLGRVAEAFDRMTSKHRVIVEALTGGYVPDDGDALIAEIDRQARDLAALLRDPSSTHMTWVTLPEAMSVEETVVASIALAERHIPLLRVIINRITPAPPDRCQWCEGRRELEAQAVTRVRECLPPVTTIGVASRATEPRGVRTLGAIGAEIAAERQVLGAPTRPRRVPSRRIAPSVARPAGRVRVLERSRSRLLLFGGKGGVGKTTCAAAAALSLAAATTDPVLLLSTDPAHSLTDALGEPVSDTPRCLRGGPTTLQVRAIDSTLALDRIRTRYTRSIDALFDRLAIRSPAAIQVDLRADRDAMHGLIELTPPGLDELAAIIDVADVMQTDVVQTIVIDTAPTGHALRLLEMPQMVHEWTKALMSILLKYQSIAGLGEVGPALIKLSQGLGRLRAMLADPMKTSFIVVTRGAALPRAETVDLMRQLVRLNIHVPAVIINAVGRGTCRRCRTEARIEQRHIAATSREIPRRTSILIAPAELPPPLGPDTLRRWRRRWTLYRDA